MSIKDSWKRIQKWHRRNTPPGTFSLNRGASERKLANFEDAIDVGLPPAFRESYLRHNGSRFGTSFLFYGQLLDLDGILKSWQRYCDWQRDNGWGGPDYCPINQLRDPDKIKEIWWNPLRLPITETADPVILDLDPAEGGDVGQLIDHNHEVGPTDVVASSFTKWIEDIANDLDEGKYIYDDMGMQVQPVDWPT